MNILGLAAALFLVASPALAQDQGTGIKDRNQNLAAPRELSAEDREKLRRTLEEAGFMQVEIRGPAAYVVRAQTVDGRQVTMFVNAPPSATDATDAPADDEFAHIRWRGPRTPAQDAGSTIEGYGAD
jgi:hypothetical protein